MAVAEINDTLSSERASGSSFYTAMRILPQAQRAAMYEVYSFCRQVDDVADSEGPREDRRRQLDQWRADISALYTGQHPARLADLARVTAQFALVKQDFIDVIDGMETDVLQDVRAPSFAELDAYCDRVASAVGRLSVNIFGMERGDGVALAHHLGRALQLSNILRDLDEDASIGRLYLPREALDAAAITTSDPVAAVANPNIGAACAPVVARAREHYAQADAIMARTARRQVRAPRIMDEYYRGIFDRLVQRGFAPPRTRVRLPRSRLAWIILRYAFI